MYIDTKALPAQIKAEDVCANTRNAGAECLLRKHANPHECLACQSNQCIYCHSPSELNGTPSECPTHAS